MKNLFKKLYTYLIEKFGVKADSLNRIEISSEIIKNNYHVLSESGMMPFPVLKSNAYGHGIEQIVRILSKERPTYFVVDGYQEALRVRNVSKTPVLILGPTAPDNVSFLQKNKFSFTINNFDLLGSVAKSEKVSHIHIALNTGMNREGFTKNELPQVIEVLQNNPQVKVEGIFSHFADADGHDQTMTVIQEKIFSECLDIFEEQAITPAWIHLGNSAGFTQTNDPRINAFRPGIALYGYGQIPSRASNSTNEKLRPALELISTITNIQQVSKGDSIGYGCTYVAEEDIQVAVVPVGYFEGVDRVLSNAGSFKVDKHFYTITGRVCMNLTCFDIGNADVSVGDEVTIISNDIKDLNSPGEIAKQTDRIVYEILVSLDGSIRRVVV